MMRRIKYIYELSEWPNFTWNSNQLIDQLAAVRFKQARLITEMGELGFQEKKEATLTILTTEVVKTSEIEGENLDRNQVRSSIAKHLGMETAAITKDSHVDGVVEMLLDATQKYSDPLTPDRLFGWHSLLFPTGRSGMKKIKVGQWRDDAEDRMKVVSGPVGKEIVHYIAPEAIKLEKEIDVFLRWFNNSGGTDDVLKAAIAHLWFVTIHPFEDGNGRIARAIADMAMARSENSSYRFYSISEQIRKERTDYYDILGKTQKSNLDITRWITWFLDCLDHAIDQSDVILARVLRKDAFWKNHRDSKINERQNLMLNKLLDGFEGKLTSSKWARITKVSQDTAIRDINLLVERGILKKEDSGGRSTSYILIEPREDFD